MSRVVQSRRIAAPAATVWTFITDPRHFPDYVDGYAHGEVTTAWATGLGAGYVWTGRLGPIRLHSKEAVTEWREGEYVGYAGTMAGVRFRSSMAVRADGDGCVLEVSIRQDVPVWLGGALTDHLLARPLVRWSVQNSLRKVAAQFSHSPSAI